MIQLHDKQFVPFLSSEEMAMQYKNDCKLRLILKMKYPFYWCTKRFFMVVSDFMKNNTKGLN
jgi:hypothetical protein